MSIISMNDALCPSCGVPLDKFTTPNIHYWRVLGTCTFHKPTVATMPAVNGIYKATYVHSSYIQSTPSDPKNRLTNFSSFSWHVTPQDPTETFLLLDNESFFAFGTDEIIGLNSHSEICTNLELILDADQNPLKGH